MVKSNGGVVISREHIMMGLLLIYQPTYAFNKIRSKTSIKLLHVPASGNYLNKGV
jgi:hypothetical protein